MYCTKSACKVTKKREQNKINQFIFMPSAFKIMTNSTLYTAEPPRVVTETVSMVETKSFIVRNTWFPYLKP